MDAQQYMQERVDDQIEWYTRKAAFNKKWHIRLEVLAIVLSVSIPFVSNFMTATTPWIKHCVSFMGVSIAAITGLVSLMKYRDNWIEYRTTCELLRHERYMFLTKVGAYASGNAFELFVQTVEDLLSKEVANWKKNTTVAADKGQVPADSTTPAGDSPTVDLPAADAPVAEPPVVQESTGQPAGNKILEARNWCEQRFWCLEWVDGGECFEIGRGILLKRVG